MYIIMSVVLNFTDELKGPKHSDDNYFWKHQFPFYNFILKTYILQNEEGIQYHKYITMKYCKAWVENYVLVSAVQ